MQQSLTPTLALTTGQLASTRQLAVLQAAARKLFDCGSIACVRFMTRGHDVSRIQSRRLLCATSELK